MNYMIDERLPTEQTEIDSRTVLQARLQPIVEEHGLEIELATAYEDGDSERVQVAFLKVSEPVGPWCIGTIIRRNSGEYRAWPRDDDMGPIQGSTVVDRSELQSVILHMIDKYTKP